MTNCAPKRDANTPPPAPSLTWTAILSTSAKRAKLVTRLRPTTFDEIRVRPLRGAASSKRRARFDGCVLCRPGRSSDEEVGLKLSTNRKLEKLAAVGPLLLQPQKHPPRHPW